MSSRDNPKYPAGHCFTVVKCKTCGEMFEPYLEHICKQKNSYPVREQPDEAFLKGFYNDHCILCGSQRCYSVYDEESRGGCETYIEEVLRKEQSP